MRGMVLLHGFLAWLTSHCWGLRVGAKWMRRVDPGWANTLFLSSSFLRFCFVVSAIEAAALAVLAAQVSTAGFPLPVLVCLAVGTATGLALGREAY